MPECQPHEFSTAELDPDLLSAPFGVQTNWHVITGTSSCGKTTLIDLLADEGFRTAPETARRYFDMEMARGRPIDEIRRDGVTAQHAIRELQLALERGLEATDVVFLDRGLPDILTHYRWRGLDPNEILPECFCHRYASVSVLDALPYRQDDVRREDEATRAYLARWVERDYTALGYDIVRVPVLPPQERLAFVLENLTDRGLL
jgi:predicted ATPase